MHWRCWRSELAKITLTEKENKHKCTFCTLYIVLFLRNFTINVGIFTYFIYFKHMKQKKTGAEKKIYFLGNNY